MSPPNGQHTPPAQPLGMRHSCPDRILHTLKLWQASKSDNSLMKYGFLTVLPSIALILAS
jgi:hypothetical protein